MRRYRNERARHNHRRGRPALRHRLHATHRMGAAMTAIDQYIAILAVASFTCGTLIGWYVRSYFAIRDNAINLSDYDSTGA